MAQHTRSRARRLRPLRSLAHWQGLRLWFGFQGGESSQWHTPLFENTAPVEPPHDDLTWHFSEAIAEKAIGWIGQQKAAAPGKPFFIYFAPGACHSPHHVHKEWA